MSPDTSKPRRGASQSLPGPSSSTTTAAEAGFASGRNCTNIPIMMLFRKKSSKDSEESGVEQAPATLQQHRRRPSLARASTPSESSYAPTRSSHNRYEVPPSPIKLASSYSSRGSKSHHTRLSVPIDSDGRIHAVHEIAYHPPLVTPDSSARADASKSRRSRSVSRTRGNENEREKFRPTTPSAQVLRIVGRSDEAPRDAGRESRGRSRYSTAAGAAAAPSLRGMSAMPQPPTSNRGRSMSRPRTPGVEQTQTSRHRRAPSVDRISSSSRAKTPVPSTIETPRLSSQHDQPKERRQQQQQQEQPQERQQKPQHHHQQEQPQFHKSEPNLSKSHDPSNNRDDDDASTSSETSENRKRKSKMEKIRQLQAKNELYKEEFKRVQKDRKKLKKELESKNQEIAAFANEIDTHIAETSRLKSKLSEAMKQLGETNYDGKEDKANINKLSNELIQTKNELSAALRRVSDLKEEIHDLKDASREKEHQIENLSLELGEEQRRIIDLQEEINELRDVLDQQDEQGKKNEKVIKGLVDENEKLQAELGSTVDRAAKMVKEREDAISDLLRENDEVRKLLSEQKGPDITQEDLEQLQKELTSANQHLEEAQDRNLVLEEELEALISKGSETEGILDRLNNDLETWQQRAKQAEATVQVLETQAIDAKAAAESAREALTNAQAKHQADVSEIENRYTAEIADLVARHKAEIAEADAKLLEERALKNSATESQQAMLLQAAVAGRKKKEGADKQGWRFLLKTTESEDEQDEKLKRLKELEDENKTQAEEIKNLKSEMVRLRSTYNETSYMAKKKIERLTDENEAYATRIAQLEEIIRGSSGFSPSSSTLLKNSTSPVTVSSSCDSSNCD